MSQEEKTNVKKSNAVKKPAYVDKFIRDYRFKF